MRVGLLRTVGVVTTAYGAVVTAWPDLLARPSGLAAGEGGTPWSTRLALRPLTWRDVVSGAALAVAPRGAALGTAALVRIAADVGDALLLGRSLPRRGSRAMVIGTAAGWAALTAYALLAPARGPEGVCAPPGGAPLRTAP
jgi:hypothetical protein